MVVMSGERRYGVCRDVTIVDGVTLSSVLLNLSTTTSVYI